MKKLIYHIKYFFKNFYTDYKVRKQYGEELKKLQKEYDNKEVPKRTPKGPAY